MIRAFLAVELNEAVKAAYGRLHAGWGGLRRELRWVRPENLHLTVRFLGESSDRELALLRAEVEAILRTVPPFPITLGAPGCFGPAPSPRVLWIGIAQGAGELGGLASRLAAAVERLGFAPEERAWSGHLTLARNPGRRRVDGWQEALSASGLCGMSDRVEHVALLASDLRPGGPEYSLVWKAALLA